MGARVREALRVVHVDFETLERIPKESYRFYREVCRTRGAAIPTDIAPMR